MTDYNDLSGQDLNRLIAERVMGLRVGKASPPGFQAFITSTQQGSTETDIHVPEMECLLKEDGSPELTMYIPGGHGLTSVPNYCGDVAAVVRLEERIGAMGTEQAYVNSLLTMLRDEGGKLTVSAWQIIRATPRQRCIAALKAIQNKEE